MLKPQGYEEARASGDYEAPLLGGHHLIIKQVAEKESKNGNQMIVVLFDFAKNDRQPDLFAKAFKDDIRPEKKWPIGGTMYIPVIGSDGQTTRGYKTFCTCYEQSNDTQIKWVEDSVQWCGQFRNKKIGGAYGLVHEVYQGEEKVRTKLRWFVTDSKVDPEKIPNEKFLSDAEQEQLRPTSKDPGFMDIPDSADDEGLPFN